MDNNGGNAGGGRACDLGTRQLCRHAGAQVCCVMHHMPALRHAAQEGLPGRQRSDAHGRKGGRSGSAGALSLSWRAVRRGGRRRSGAQRDEAGQSCGPAAVVFQRHLVRDVVGTRVKVRVVVAHLFRGDVRGYQENERSKQCAMLSAHTSACKAQCMQRMACTTAPWAGPPRRRTSPGPQSGSRWGPQ